MHQDREIRQESYLATKYEKARQDVGFFYIVFLSNFPRIKVKMNYKENKNFTDNSEFFLQILRGILLHFFR